MRTMMHAAALLWVLFYQLYLCSCDVSAENCAKIRNKKPPAPIDKNNKYKLWPGLMSQYDIEHGESLPGMEEALEIIWKNQNPPDCSKAKYLITEPFLQGVGSEMHVYGVGLGIAIETGRVFLQQGGWSWRFKNSHCASQNKLNMECYYMPLSKCTLQDALATMQTINPEYPQPVPPGQRTNSTEAAHRQLKTTIKPRPPNKANHPVHPAGAQFHTPAAGTVSKAAAAGWSNREDADLEAAVIRHGVNHQWQLIALAVQRGGSTKTDVECIHRFRNVLRKKLNHRGGPGPKGKPNFNDDHTVADLALEGYGVVSMSRVTEVAHNAKTNSMTLVVKHPDKFAESVLMIATSVMLEKRTYVANAFLPVLRCLNVYKQAHSHFWWRAISVTFFLRPNEATLKLLDQHSDPVLKGANGKCVSTYVRHGDKGIEMSLIPFQKYADVAYCVWEGRPSRSAAVIAATKTGGSTATSNSSALAVPAATTTTTNSSSSIAGGTAVVAASIPGNAPSCAVFLTSAAQNDRRLVQPSGVPKRQLSQPVNPASRAKPGHNAAIHAKRAQAAASTIEATEAAKAAAAVLADENENASAGPIDISGKPFLAGWDSATEEKVFYLGSEDPLVFSQAKVWAAQHKVNLRYSNISQVLLSDRKGIMKHRDMETSMPANRQMEYFSYLLHLNDLLKCRAMVCTLASNYCRLLDEMRATVGGKAGAYMADLSTDSCARPPCVRPFSIADYQGTVYDPTFDKLWRL